MSNIGASEAYYDPQYKCRVPTFVPKLDLAHTYQGFQASSYDRRLTAVLTAVLILMRNNLHLMRTLWYTFS